MSKLTGSELAKIQQTPDNVLLRFLLSDSVMHWGAFAVLSGLLFYGFYHSLMNDIPFIKVILLGIGYVLFIEIYKAFHRGGILRLVIFC